MLCGWAREVTEHPNYVIYRAPCGRRLRKMDELHRYLSLTGSQLGVDLYSFDSRVKCFKKFQPERICTYVNGRLNPSY